MLLLLLIGLLAAVAVRGAGDVNLCDYNEAMPLLYHEYTSTDCPPAFELKPDGNCADQVDWSSPITCASFCQMRSNFYWGREQPFLRVPFCRSGLTCKLSNSVHQGYSWKIKVNQNIKIVALTTGNTGGWANKWGWTQSYSLSKHMEDGECGYWTFVPIIREACGTYTSSPYNQRQERCIDPFSSIGNFCTEQLNYFSSSHSFKNDRTLRGAVMFVFVDCDTLAPSPDEKQDPGWIHDGVRLPRDNGALINAYETIWKQNDDSFEATSDSSICNSDQHPTPPAYAYANATDCEGAIMDLMDDGANLVPGGNPSPDVTVATEGSCAIKVVYDEQWKDGCEVNFLEVAAGAQAIIDSCTDWDDETTGGNHFLRKTGNCGCHVRFQSGD